MRTFSNNIKFKITYSTQQAGNRKNEWDYTSSGGYNLAAVAGKALAAIIEKQNR